MLQNDSGYSTNTTYQNLSSIPLLCTFQARQPNEEEDNDSFWMDQEHPHPSSILYLDNLWPSFEIARKLRWRFGPVCLNSSGRLPTDHGVLDTVFSGRRMVCTLSWPYCTLRRPFRHQQRAALLGDSKEDWRPYHAVRWSAEQPRLDAIIPSLCAYLLSGEIRKGMA